jgi:hypothetical protein
LTLAYLVAGLSTLFAVVSIELAEESGIAVVVSIGALCIAGAEESAAASSVVVLSVHDAIKAAIAIIDKNFFI